MNDQHTSYRQIMKATSLFGGVQVFKIIIQIIRSKVIAVLLGPAGIGIIGLLNSTVAIIGCLTNFGLSTSAVKDIASAVSSENKQRISTIVIVFRRLVWITGILGMLVTLVLSPWLSWLTFGNYDYTIAFIWISITLLFSQLSSGQLVILQGMRKLQYLAKANLLGSALGLIVTLPLYYFLGVDGIVPGIIGYACVTFLLSRFYSRKIKIESTRVSLSQTLQDGKNMLFMGSMITLGGLFSTSASYIVSIFISHTGGIDQVGLYNTGSTIINTYVGLIFAAMATDYYPRLSTVAHDNKLCKQSINEQAEIAVLILAPILLVFLTFINLIIIFLYSKQFLAVNGMIYWAALGMFFKATSWAIGFIFLAKGAGKIFLASEIIANIYFLAFNIISYYFWGLTGIGFSFLISYIICLVQVYYISKIKFAFAFDLAFVRVFFIQFGLATLCFLSVTYLNEPYTYITGFVLICISGLYSFRELNKRLGLMSMLRKYTHR